MISAYHLHLLLFRKHPPEEALMYGSVILVRRMMMVPALPGSREISANEFQPKVA